MRIISGKFKGRSIKFLKSKSTRPLKDSVKENLFNILIHSNKFKININNSKVVDMYAGVGSFGLECLSRGAKKVVFIERDKKVFEILRNNLISCSLKDKSFLVNGNIKDALRGYLMEKFNLFFFDPPFADNEYIENLKFINSMRIYENEHLVMIHREKNTVDNLTDCLNVIDIKKYGRSKIIFGSFK